MNAQMILSSLSYTSYDYLDDAAACLTNDPSPSAKRRPNIRFSLIVAAIVAIVMIPLAVIIANHYGITPPPIPVITTPEETYKSLTDIPGAVKVDPENGIAKIDSREDLVDRYEYAQSLKKATSRVSFVGIAEYIESVTISDGDYYWTLMTFDVTVEKAIWNTEPGQTFRVLATCFYTQSESFNNYLREFFPDQGLKLLETPRAFFSIYPTIRPHWAPTFQGIPLDLSSYADYTDTIIYQTDGEGFDYFGSRIDFSEIIPDPTEDPPTPSSTS